MAPAAVFQQKIDKVLTDIQTLIEDVSSLVDQDETARKRLQEVKDDPLIGRTENELDNYLKKRTTLASLSLNAQLKAFP